MTRDGLHGLGQWREQVAAVGIVADVPVTGQVCLPVGVVDRNERCLFIELICHGRHAASPCARSQTSRLRTFPLLNMTVPGTVMFSRADCVDGRAAEEHVWARDGAWRCAGISRGTR